LAGDEYARNGLLKGLKLVNSLANGRDYYKCAKPLLPKKYYDEIEKETQKVDNILYEIYENKENSREKCADTSKKIEILLETAILSELGYLLSKGE
jgi:hypothetical protein